MCNVNGTEGPNGLVQPQPLFQCNITTSTRSASHTIGDRAGVCHAHSTPSYIPTCRHRAPVGRPPQFSSEAHSIACSHPPDVR